MALCIECKADYLPHITVCPACNRALEADPLPPPSAPAEHFVPFLTAGYPEGMAAAASLEAAGLETRLTTMDFHVYLGTPLHVTVLVRERDLDAACTALKKPAPPLTPEAASCVICGAAASVHETERRGAVVSTTHYCVSHASLRVPAEPCDSHVKADQDVLKAVEALNARKGVRTVCSCSGSHAGATEGFISLAPAAANPESEKLFDAFVNSLQGRVKEPDWAARVAVEWSAVHGAEITLVERPPPRQTWEDLARLVADLP
ncbi:MAG TPA: hypothetical protein VFC86_03720 [Planctomycetota bacterium]|nr:hypothetical protein [Planctomycetota bacterium]